MIRLLLTFALLLFEPLQPQTQTQTQTQYDISYRLAMPRPASHLFEVTIDVTIPANDSAGFIDFQMPKWQPGRYSIADFAANACQGQAPRVRSMVCLHFRAHAP